MLQSVFEEQLVRVYWKKKLDSYEELKQLNQMINKWANDTEKAKKIGETNAKTATKRQKTSA